jgi:DNA repair exonuclease SbcCD nuclease subunit
MDALFKKALVIADIHFGRSGNSPIANKDNLDFLVWAIDEAKTWGAETAIMLGDWHDNRHSLHVSTILASLDGMDLLNNAFKQVWWLPGNHDLLFRERRDAASIEFARYQPNVRIIRNPLVIDDVTFLPWLVQDEHKELVPTTRYVFGHLELPGFMMNVGVQAQEHEDGVTTKQFGSVDYLFTGHFHMRQLKGNVFYTGNVMPFNFSDDGDADRGAMFLEFGKEPFFKPWPGQPLYKSVKLSDLLADPDGLLKQNMTLRCHTDLALRYEETQEIREMLVKTYGLRKVEFNNSVPEATPEFDEKVQVRTVDQVVIEGLMTVESVELSANRLVQMYNGLNL